MVVSNVGSTGSTPLEGKLNTTRTSNQIENPNSQMGKTEFLQMLITKLQYQDPTKPITDDSFIADMAQFSSLEQMQNLNSSFTNQSSSMDNLNQNLVALIMMQNTSQAAGLIGKTVTVSTTVTASDGTTSAGPDVTGPVSTVKFVDGQPIVVVNGIEYGLASIKEISA